MKNTMILFITLMLGFVTSAFAHVNMQEGNWEIETSMKMERMPFPMPPMKVTYCYTKKDMEDGSKMRSTDGGAGKKNDCEMKDLVEKKNTASWKLVCKDGTSGSAEATYKGDSYSVNMKMFDKSGREMINTSVNGSRLGDCK